MERVSKENYYLDIAQTVAERSTCLRRCYGAIIVKDDTIVSTGYNGAPRGRKNCSDLGYCMREKLQIPRGERYEMCRSLHSEANAIISANPIHTAALWGIRSPVPPMLGKVKCSRTTKVKKAVPMKAPIRRRSEGVLASISGSCQVMYPLVTDKCQRWAHSSKDAEGDYRG